MRQIERVTEPTLDVLEVLLGADDAIWGLQAIKASGRKAGTVYPILERLERLGWVSSHWGDEPERVGPRRRYYQLTAEGRSAAIAVLSERRTPAASGLRGATA